MDPNTALMFESIGLIKKSLQCSICLDLFNDPHSTRCNHQFCSPCIRKVVDERKNKKKEALCPLCKNPITKRSLTSNPRLKEIVDVVGKLNIAFQEDAGLPDSPYPLVNSRLNGESYLQFARLNPTPLKPGKLKSRKLGGAMTEQLLNSCVNHQSSKYGLRSRAQHEESTSTQEVNKQTSAGMEILSLLESQEDVQPEGPTEYIDKEVNKVDDETLQKNCGNTEFPKTRRSFQPTGSQTAKSQENVNTANTTSSGSLTVDAGSQSSVFSNDSVSMLNGLLSQESAGEVQQNSDINAAMQLNDAIEPHHTLNKQNISKSSQAGDNANCPFSERGTGNSTNSNDMFNEVQKSPNVNHELRKTSPKVAINTPSSSSRNDNHELRKTSPKITINTPSSSSRNVNKGNLLEETCEQYSSERVPASVESDSQSYRVIPLPRYQRLYSDDEISPEFPPEKDNCFDEIIYSNAEKSQVCVSPEKHPIEGDAIQTKKCKVALSAENVPNVRAENWENSEALLPSGGSSRHQKSKRKLSDEDKSHSRKYQRLNSKEKVSSIEIDNETYKNNLETNRRTNLDTDQVNSPVMKVIKELPVHVKVADPQLKNPSHDQNCSQPQVTDTCDDSEDIIPPTPPVRMDLGCSSPKKTNNSTLVYTRRSWTSRSKLGEVDEIDEDNCVKDGVCNDGGVVSAGNPIMDDDQMYSSQEELLFREDEPDDQDNVALLRRLASTFSCHKESELESDDETSDYTLEWLTQRKSSRNMDGGQTRVTGGKAGDTTSISSLTDGDSVEISSQRVKYLHKVLAQTGGEIEKLTTDLNSLKKIEADAELVELGHDHVDVDMGPSLKSVVEGPQNRRMDRDNVSMNTDDARFGRDDARMNGDDLRINWDDLRMDRNAIGMNREDLRKKRGNVEIQRDNMRLKRDMMRMNRDDVRMNKEDVKNDSSSDKDCDSDERDSDCDSSSEKENENIETFDKENNIEIIEDTNGFYEKVNENGATSDIENENGETSDIENENGENSDMENENGENSDIENENGENSDVENENGENSYIENENGENSDIENENGENSDIENENGENSDIENENGENSDIENENGENSDIEHENGETSDKENENGEISDKENENGENSDIENENGEISDKENENGENSDIENENGETSDMENESGEISDKENENGENSDIEIENGENSDKENDVKKNDNDDYESDDALDDDDDDEDGDDDDDVEILEHCSLSPPPSLEPSTLKLTKLPAAIKNMQRFLQQDSEDDLDTTRPSNLRGNPSEVEEVFQNKRSRDAPASKARYHGLPLADKSADVQITQTEGRLAGSQKENDAELKQRPGSRKFPLRRPRDSDKQDVMKHGGHTDGVLAELGVNTSSKKQTLTAMLGNELRTGPKQLALTAMLGNGLNHDARKKPRHVKPSVCFVVTRLPKQFVSLAGHLAKGNDGKVCGDVTEETTHIIMPTDSRMHASRKNYTVKYLLGIALGKWIVSQLWITASAKSGRLLDEKQYEVKGDVEAAQSHVPNLARTTRQNKGPLLFDDISVVCFGEFSGAISQDHVSQLVRYCGGQVIDFSKELLTFGSTMSDLIIICNTILSENTELQIKDLCRRYSTFPVSVEWVTDSVANYQLQDIEEYRMDI